MTFEPLTVLWLKAHKNKTSFSQYKNLRCYTSHLDRYIDGMDVSQVKPTSIDAPSDILTDRSLNTGRPASRQTLVDVRSTANRIFKYGIDLELIIRNPARGHEVSRYVPRRHHGTLMATERGLIILAPHRTHVGALVMMLAGLQRGELIPFTWDDINLDVLKISVTKSAESRNNNRLVIKSDTKTSWGRMVNITFDLALELQKAKTVTRLKYIRSRTDGEVHTLISWRRMWGNCIKTLRKAPGADQTSIQEITAHYLRHTYATLLYLSGVDVLTTTKLFGHSNVETTIAIYMHLDDLMLSGSADKLDNYLFSALFRSSAQVCTLIPKLDVRRVTDPGPASSITKGASCKTGYIFSSVRFLSS